MFIMNEQGMNDFDVGPLQGGRTDVSAAAGRMDEKLPSKVDGRLAF